MASVSFQVNAGRQDGMDPDSAIATGTAAPTSETFEFRWNQASAGGVVPTRQDAIRALESFIRYIENTRFTIGTAL